MLWQVWKGHQLLFAPLLHVFTRYAHDLDEHKCQDVWFLYLLCDAMLPKHLLHILTV